MNTRRVSLITFAFAMLACTELPIAGDSRATPDLSSQRAPYNMPTSISPASPPTISMTIPIPNDGESANHLSLKQFVQPLTDDAEAFRLLTYGGGIQRRVTCTSNTALTIQPLGAVVVRDSAGVWTVLQHSMPTTVSPAVITGGLGPSQRYWLYAYLNGGSLDFIAVTANPDLGLRYQNGDEKYLYVSTFYTDHTSTVLRYTQSNLEFRYYDQTATGGGVRGNLVLDQGTAIVNTTVTFSAVVPSTAQIVRMTTYVASAAVNTSAIVQSSDPTAPYLQRINNAVSTDQSTEFTLSNLNNSVDYQVSVNTTSLSLWIAGFTF